MVKLPKRIVSSQRVKKFSDVRNIALYLFALIVVAITWSGVKTIQTNYELQKKIATLQQQNAILDLQNQNAALQNKYLATNQYLDLAARQDFGLAAPGEKVLLVPNNVAMKYVDPDLVSKSSTDSSSDNRPRYIKNLEDWRDFLLGRKVFGD